MSDTTMEPTRSNLVQSLPLLKQRRQDLADRIESSLGQGETASTADGEAEKAATVLLDLLLGEAEHWIEQGEISPLGHAVLVHEKLGISGRHYSRFGDFLVPILKDILGLPSSVAASWCDFFWRVIRAVESPAAVARA